MRTIRSWLFLVVLPAACTSGGESTSASDPCSATPACFQYGVNSQCEDAYAACPAPTRALAACLESTSACADAGQEFGQAFDSCVQQQVALLECLQSACRSARNDVSPGGACGCSEDCMSPSCKCSDGHQVSPIVECTGGHCASVQSTCSSASTRAYCAMTAADGAVDAAVDGAADAPTDAAPDG